MSRHSALGGMPKTRPKLKHEPFRQMADEKANDEIGRVKESKTKTVLPTMQSFLISSKDREEASKKADSLCSKNKIDKIDIDNINFEKSVGIEDVRIIQKKIYLKPIKSEAKAIILKAYNGLTIEAQNALLKILEEPPNNTIILLLVETGSQVLPTILSRCKNITIDDKREKFGELEEDQIAEILSSLSTCGAGKRLKLAQDFGKSREEAIIWLEKMIIILRKILLNKINSSVDPRGWSLKELIELINKLEEGRLTVKNTNINQRFALENLFLSI